MKLLSKLVFIGAMLFSVLGMQNNINSGTSNDNASEVVNNQTSSIVFDKDKGHDIRKNLASPYDCFSSGDGSQTSPYIISSANDFILFSNNVNFNVITDEMMKYKFFKIDDNLDSMTLTDFTPIGNEAHPFSGSFDGNDCKFTYTITENGTNSKWNSYILY